MPVPAADRRQARKDLVRIERQMERRLRQEETPLHEDLARHASDYAAVQPLDQRLRAVVSETAAPSRTSGWFLRSGSARAEASRL